MNQFFGSHFPKLRLTCLQFDCLVETFLPDLNAVLQVYNLSAEVYAQQWFLTLFSYSIPFSHVLCVWDQFLCRGMKFLHCVGLALLKQARGSLLDLRFDNMMQTLRSVGDKLAMSPKAFIANALAFKVTNRLLVELEHVLTTGGPALPRCFRERNLDTGRTRWRVIPPDLPTLKQAGLRPANPVDTLPPKGCSRFRSLPSVRLVRRRSLPTSNTEVKNSFPSSLNHAFFEGALPPTRIPCDPLSPLTTLESDEPCISPVSSRAGATRRLHKMVPSMNEFLHRRKRMPPSPSSVKHFNH